jgi:crotonobetainyl-CoA:carnitine CoA-transferase CaiB-like acyl-CoA transferase
MDLAADPRFADIPARRAHLAELTQALDGLFMTRKAQDWSDLFAGQVPFAPVKDLKSALENPFVAEVGMRDIVAHPAKPEGLHMLASPIMINGQRMAGHRAPTLGEQTVAILTALSDDDENRTPPP